MIRLSGRRRLSKTLKYRVIVPPVDPDADYFVVSPTGSALGNGTEDFPWDIRTGFQSSYPSPTQPLYLRGGTYQIISDLAITATGDDADNMLTVSSYPSEWAVIEDIRVQSAQGSSSTGANTALTVSGDWVIVRDFEVWNSATRRTFDTLTEPSRPQGVNLGGAGTCAVNLIIHDCHTGIGRFDSQSSSEIHGNLIYNSGERYGGIAHGVSLYLQNQRPHTVTLKGNIILHRALGWNYAQANTTSAGWIDNIHYVDHTNLDGGLIWEAGANSVPKSSGAVLDGVWMRQFPSFRKMNEVRFRNNVFAQTVAGLGTSPSFEALNPVLDIKEMQDNVFTSHIGLGPAPNPSALPTAWDNNSYRYDPALGGTGGVHWPIRDVVRRWTGYGFPDTAMTLAEIRTAWGYDVNSTMAGWDTIGVMVDVVANDYEEGRGVVRVFDPMLEGEAEVDLSPILENGDTYWMFSAKNIDAPPVATGTWNGTPITLDLTDLPDTIEAVGEGEVNGATGTVNPDAKLEAFIVRKINTIRQAPAA